MKIAGAQDANRNVGVYVVRAAPPGVVPFAGIFYGIDVDALRTDQSPPRGPEDGVLSSRQWIGPHRKELEI